MGSHSLSGTWNAQLSLCVYTTVQKRSINTFSLQKQCEASLKTLQEEDECRARLTEAAKETRQEMLVGGAAIWVHRGGQTASFPLQHPPPSCPRL